MSEYDFLKDEDNIKLVGKISNLIDTQLPNFVKNEGLNFTEFLKFYYKWMESHELTISTVIQDEYHFNLESEQGSFVLETNDDLLLEGGRTDVSAYDLNETITGLSSGATGTVDRNTNTSSSKIYVTGVTKTDFEVGETIKGTNNRTLGTVVSFQKNPLFASRTLLKSRDVDSASSSMLDHFTKEFLVNIPMNLSADKSLLIKHISDIYRAKGTSPSYDFLFKSLYDIQDLIFYTPKIDLLKLSSGNWQQDQSIRIISSDPISSFESHSIVGKQSGATGIVNRIENFAAGVFNVTELFLTDIVGTFIVGESVGSNDVDGVFGNGVSQGLLSEVVISSAGSNYKVNDKLTFTGGGGVEAKAKVTSVGQGTLTRFTVFDGGDGYVEDKALDVNNFATFGTGFEGKIKDVIDTFTFSKNEDTIGNFSATIFNATAYELSGDVTANSEDRLIDTLGFSKLDAGAIGSIQTTGTGAGYEAIPQISVTEITTDTFTENSIQILNLNADPDELATTNAITGFFDAGEKITSNSGNKIGTFFGDVFTSYESEIKNPSRIRVKTIKFLDEDVTQKIPVAQRNDLQVNNSSYLATTYPSIYHLQFVTGGSVSVNTIKYRRGIDSREDFNSVTNVAKADWYPTSGGVTVTGGYQTLSFGITTLQSASTTATAVTYGKHGLEDGQIVAIAGASPVAYNGSATITVASDTSFTYSFVGSATSFTGSGLDDLTYGGAYTGASVVTYRVKIDLAAATDTFTWSDDGGSSWDATGVAITGSAQELNNGITVTFAATTGHVVDEYWDMATLPATGTITYNENISVKFTLPFGHTTDDEYAFSTIDFVSNEVITGANSGASATVNTGVAFSAGGELGNNASVGVSAADVGTGSIKSIEIQDPGVGFTSAPLVTLPGLGSENANLIAKISAMRAETGLYLDENGQLSSGKKLIDSDFYQDYSYSLIANKQLNEYQEIVFKLLHPTGTKLFGEFTPNAVELNVGFDSRLKFEGGDSAVKEDDDDDILLEEFSDPRHDIIFNNNQNLGTGTITLSGNSDIVLGDTTKTLGSTTFTGSGLDDITFGGSYNGSSALSYRVKIDAAAATDTFTWSDDGGSTWDATGVPMGTSAHTLNNGITVIFAATTGHTLNDYWDMSTIITTTDFSATYGEGDHIVVDNEQSFEVSYGELRLENYLAGTISTSTSNVISIIGLGNTYPKVSTVPNDFSASGNFVANSIVTQINTATNEKVTGVVLRHELDDSNNNILILHSCNGTFDISSNANSTVGDTSVIDINTYNMILEGGVVPVYDDDGHSGYADLTGSLALEQGYGLILALEDSIYQNNESVTTATFQYVKSNVIFGTSTDFQADFRINDRIKTISTSQNTKVIEVINSTCLIGNTAISTDISFNIILEEATSGAPGNYIAENSDNIIHNMIEPSSSKFDNEDIQFYNLLESTVRGTTDAGGIVSGNTNLVGTGSFFGEDLLVNDVISLSSDTLLKAKILSITDQTLNLNIALGNGSIGQTITSHTIRNFDLERSVDTITLSNPYDASNNFMNVTISSIETGLLLLEDGIGTANAGYLGNTSTEGSFKFEILSSFDNQTPKFVQT